MENKLIAKGTTTDINFFTLTINDKPIIVITENEFKYKGELIEDGGEIYKLFKNYLESYQKEVHKQEIKKVWFDSTMQFDNSSKMTNYKSFEDYYQETYGSKGSDECYFEPTTNTSSATICKHCGREKFMHTELQQINQDNPVTRGSTALVPTSSQTLKENHIGDTNEMVDQVPDVRKMVDDDKETFLLWVRRNYERCKTGWIDLETGNKHRIEPDLVYEYYQLHPTSSQTEISDEEIEEAAKNAWSDYVFDEGNLYYTTFKGGWEYAIKWYREQLKQRQ